MIVTATGLRLRPIGKVLLVVLIALEVGLVPSGALEPEHGRRHQALQLRLAAIRAFLQRHVIDFLHGLEVMAAVLALILVKRHVIPVCWPIIRP